MEEVLQISSVESLVAIYNRHHNTYYHRNELLCYHCNSWLYSEFILEKKGRRLCIECGFSARDDCKIVYATNNPRQFPCKYYISGCTDFLYDIVEHEKTCRVARQLVHRKAVQNTITLEKPRKSYEETKVCQCFCNITLTNESIIPHLREKHSMQTTKLEKPKVSLPIEIDKINAGTTTNLPFYLSAGYTLLIVIVSYETSSNQFNVIISNITEIPRNMSYKATLIHKGIGYFKFDTVYDQFISISERNHFYIPNIQHSVTLNIYFENYEAIQPLLEYFDTVIKDYECPICMEIIKDSCYQCTNGHNICVKCKGMLDTCPTCRTTFNANIISIKRLTPNFLKPCKNAVNGCFIYRKEAELVDHERDCPMKNITCEICTTDFDKDGYIVHMTRQHGMKKLDKTPAIIEPGFVFYKGHIFEFIVENRVIEEETNIVLYKWSIRLINCSETFCDREFEMTIEYSEIFITMKGKVSNNLYQNSFSVNNATTPIFTLTFQF